MELGSLKRFLKIRDENELFEPVKTAGRIGLPTIIIDGQVILDFDEQKLDALLKE